MIRSIIGEFLYYWRVFEFSREVHTLSKTRLKLLNYSYLSRLNMTIYAPFTAAATNEK